MPRRSPTRRTFVAAGLTLALTACGAARPAPEAPGVPRAEPSADWYLAQGSAAANRGESARAEQYLTLALERGGDGRQVMPLLLSVCLRSGQLRAALNHAESYLRNHPEDVGLRYLVASIDSGIGATERARLELERILREEPDYARAHYLLAMLELDAGSDEARTHLERYLELEPRGEHAEDVRSRIEELGR
jgi:tetratricopeptide (TPR) repeat protein